MSSDESSIISWVLTGVSAVIATVTSGLAYVSKKLVGNYEERIKDLEGVAEKLLSRSEKCEQEHGVTKIELAKISQKIEMLECKRPGSQ